MHVSVQHIAWHWHVSSESFLLRSYFESLWIAFMLVAHCGWRHSKNILQVLDEPMEVLTVDESGEKPQQVWSRS